MPLDPEVRRLAEDTNIAHLATILPDGSPHSVPLWIGTEGERLVVLTSPSSVKARNVGRDPRVSLSITDHERPNTMAHVRGRVVDVVDGEEGWRLIDKLANAYIGQDYPLREDRVALVIEVDRAFAQAF
jgi:PPOX class probable F420-dependent enzyme